MFKNLSKIFLVGIIVCIAVYIGIFIGRTNSSDLISVPKTKSEEFHKIDLNSATIDELIEIPGVSTSVARAIINYRSDYGNFDRLRELLYIDGIDEGLYQTICQYVTINKD